MLVASLLAGVGGVLWGFGILGKRIGVHGATNHDKDIRSTFTIFVYTLTTLIVPIFDFVRILATDPELVKDTFRDPVWVRRIPFIVLCGLISGLGGLLGTIAIAWSAGVNSALISMVENGTYTMSGALLIAIFFGERPGPLQYVSAGMIMLGILFASGTTGRQHKHPCDECVSDGSDSSDVEAMDKQKTGSTALASEDGGANSDCSVETNSSVLSTSSVAPVRLRKRAIGLAIAAGMCWGFGPVGKKDGVAHPPEGYKHVWTTCTYLVYMSSTPLVALVRLACSDPLLRREAMANKRFLWLLCGTMVCGLLSGLGGLISTLAFANAAQSSALVSMIENGVYTVSGALLIVVLFKEPLTKRQTFSALMVVAGLIVSAAV